MILLGRRYLPQTPPTGRHRLDVIGSLMLGAATFCVLFGAVEYELLGPPVVLLVIPAALLLFLFWRRERRLTRDELDPLVDLRLFRRPSYTAGVVLALLYFPAMAGLPLVLALYFQRGLGFSALHSALGVTAFAVGSAVSAQTGRPVRDPARPSADRGGHARRSVPARSRWRWSRGPAPDRARRSWCSPARCS